MWIALVAGAALSLQVTDQPFDGHREYPFDCRDALITAWADETHTHIALSRKPDDGGTETHFAIPTLVGTRWASRGVEYTDFQHAVAVVAVGIGYRVLLTTDCGKSWTIGNDIEIDDASPTIVIDEKSIAIDGFRSRDFGKTWTRIPNWRKPPRLPHIDMDY